MNLELKYPILTKLLRPFRKSQQKTCLAIVSALLEAARANSFAIASELAQQSGIGLPSAVNRLYRFLRNSRFDNWLLTEQLFELFAERKRIVLCLDWTAWGDKFSLLVASVCVERRSLPLAVSAVKKSLLARSQNLWEETFLRLCVDRLKSARVKTIWLCDRGFHRVMWLLALKQLKQDFVVRLQRDVLVEIDGQKQLLGKIVIDKGEYRDFGLVSLRVDGKVKVHLVGVWAHEAKEVWWLATNLKLSVAEIVGLYDRRMSVEEQFRDSKGTHFGLKLRWTCFERGEYLERMYLLVGVAMLLWTSIGRAIEKEKPKVRLKCYCRHRARLSLLRVGILFWRDFTEGLKLTTKFIKANLPLPKVRIFPWLQIQQK